MRQDLEKIRSDFRNIFQIPRAFPDFTLKQRSESSTGRAGWPPYKSSATDEHR
jgi:hypothetical protein